MSMNQLPTVKSSDKTSFLQNTAPIVAYEIASGLYDLEDILARHDWTVDEFKRIGASEPFRHMVQEAKAEWSTVDSQERIRLKAKVASEEGMLTVYGMINDDNIPPVVRLDAYKTLTRMAGVDAIAKAAEGEGSGGKFQIVLNFGGPQTPMTITGETLPNDSSED